VDFEHAALHQGDQAIEIVNGNNLVAFFRAKELLAIAQPAPAIKRYTFTEQGEDALGMACGGTAEVLLEAVGSGTRLIIFGAIPS
jgi:xanthine/CO dehydrogenase XdhC/CoxF family maturation factor